MSFNTQINHQLELVRHYTSPDDNNQELAPEIVGALKPEGFSACCCRLNWVVRSSAILTTSTW